MAGANLSKVSNATSNQSEPPENNNLNSFPKKIKIIYLLIGFIFLFVSMIGLFYSINRASDNEYALRHNRIMARIISAERIPQGKSYTILGTIQFDARSDGAHPCLVGVDFGQNDLMIPGIEIEIVPRNDTCADPIMSFGSPVAAYVFEAIGLLIGLVFLGAAFQTRSPRGAPLGRSAWTGEAPRYIRLAIATWS